MADCGSSAAIRRDAAHWGADWRRRRRAGTGSPRGISPGNAGPRLERRTQHQVRHSFQRRRYGRARAYAAELLALAPNAILANTAQVVSAFQQQTRTIPIVFVQVLDPVSSGFVESLAR